MFSPKRKNTNLYDTALQLIKNNETKVNYESINGIMARHKEFPLCNVGKSDVINVLYDSNTAFRSTLESNVLKSVK